MANLNRRHRGDIDQMPFGIAIISGSNFTSGALAHHGNYDPSRTAPASPIPRSYVTLTPDQELRFASNFSFSQLPPDQTGSLAALGIQSQVNALNAVVAELRPLIPITPVTPAKTPAGHSAALTPLQRARQEWEQVTTPCTKMHYIGKNPYRDEFRQYGQAIAWLEWDDEFIQITKIEALQPGRGAATKLIGFLKTLADKYQVRLFGNAVVYRPDPPIPEGNLLSQAELEGWYKKHGFQLRKIGDTCLTAIWYPDAPPTPDEPSTR
jgi:hypothetical protein